MASQETKDGGPAFPHSVDPFVDHPVHGRIHRAQLGETHTPGMSLRDYFAAAALQGILAFPGTLEGDSTKHRGAAARLAYQFADAMLAERAKSEPRQ